jgi:hypothetical protein
MCTFQKRPATTPVSASFCGLLVACKRDNDNLNKKTETARFRAVSFKRDKNSLEFPLRKGKRRPQGRQRGRGRQRDLGPKTEAQKFLEFSPGLLYNMV